MAGTDDYAEYMTVSFYGLALGYTALAVVALVQLIRIERRVPEYGWTTQKVFHLLNFLVCLLRALVLGFNTQLQSGHQALLKCLLFDLPGIHLHVRTLLCELLQSPSRSRVLRPFFKLNNMCFWIL